MGFAPGTHRRATAVAPAEGLATTNRRRQTPGGITGTDDGPGGVAGALWHSPGHGMADQALGTPARVNVAGTGLGANVGFPRGGAVAAGFPTTFKDVTPG